ncbi:hypothetical protein B0H16DRAFT_1522792 [Mycena metata]|uniref:Uncharacterized protein n=1 Tax=Mycena metata TaxID=1033252 RepID=A0AAD7JLW3_9AGAR|nr:hypothetical protein B0H16DRAFT_1522792 [Mycena metata]
MEHSPTNAEPYFPPELEREIFELAAVWYPRAIPALLRVCHRVHYWIEPLLYTVLPLDSHRSIRAVHGRLTAKPFLRIPPIEHILVDLRLLELTEWRSLNQILSPESKLDIVIKGGILDSALDYKSFLTPLRQMPQHVTFEFARDLEIYIFLREPVFSTVTHLTLLYTDQYTSVIWGHYWSSVAHLPALTHLCLTANASRVILPRLLDECPRLKAVVTTWLTPADSRARVEAFSYVLTVPDPRVVVTNLPDFFDEWERTARCGYDLWMRADEFIARKRRGEIPAGHYLLDDLVPRICC